MNALQGWIQLVVYGLLLIVAGSVWWVTTKRAKTGAPSRPSWLQLFSPTPSAAQGQRRIQTNSNGDSLSRAASRGGKSQSVEARALANEVREVLDDIYREFMAETQRLTESFERSHAALRHEVEQLRSEVLDLKQRVDNTGNSTAKRSDAAVLSDGALLSDVPPVPVNPYRAARTTASDDALPMSVILDRLTSTDVPQWKPSSDRNTGIQQTRLVSSRPATLSEPPVRTATPKFDDRYMEIFDELQKGNDPRTVAEKLGIEVSEVVRVQRVMR